MAYLLQLLSSYSDIKKNYKTYQKTKTQLDETEKASEPDKAGMVVYSDQKIQTTMINMLTVLVDKSM